MQNGNVSNRAKIDYLQFEQLARNWSNITVLKLKSSIQQNKIGKTGKLLNSFTTSVNAGSGDYLKIMLTYLYYGKFVDMGVGNGINMAAALRGGKFKRKRKLWYSKTIAKEMSKLTYFMAKSAGNQTATILLDFPIRVEI